MRIGELAERAGVDVQTVRYYEREALIDAPPRTSAGYRNYGAEHLQRLNFVRHCRSLDMSLADVRQLLDLASSRNVSCEVVDDLVQGHLDRVRAKRSALQGLEQKLEMLRSQCESGHRVADCGILEELINAAQGEACACHRSKG